MTGRHSTLQPSDQGRGPLQTTPVSLRISKLCGSLKHAQFIVPHSPAFWWVSDDAEHVLSVLFEGVRCAVVITLPACVSQGASVLLLPLIPVAAPAPEPAAVLACFANVLPLLTHFLVSPLAEASSGLFFLCL